MLDRRDRRRGWSVRPEHFDAVANAGFGLLRLPVCWWGHGRAEPPYTLEPSWLEAAGELSDAALARGLEVVLTMHHADAVSEDPAGASAWLSAAWSQIAARFAGTPGPLAFELLNEPRMSAAEWNELLRVALRAVRDVDPERPVVVGGADASSLPGLRELDVPVTERIVATLHYYEPFRFTHQGASWEPGSDAWLGTRWGTDADRAAVTADLEEAAEWARRRGVPLLVGEFGVVDAADHESRLAWTSWVRHELDRLGLDWAYWDFATDFGAYDLERGTWHADLLTALGATVHDV